MKIEPEIAGSGDPLTLNISGSIDSDGDTISYRSVWFKNGTEYATTDQIQAQETQKGEEWSVEVYATDGRLESTPGTDSTVIVNGAPIIEVTIDAPDGLYNDKALECMANIVEPDGDAFTHTVEWVSTVPNRNRLQHSTFGTHRQSNDTVTCTVTATDTENATREVQESVSLLNRTPQISTLL